MLHHIQRFKSFSKMGAKDQRLKRNRKADKEN